MRNRRGRYYKVDLNKPQAKGICDRSGFAFNHSDLVRQMEWRGESLEWTGLTVGRPFLDEPNEQFRIPEVGPDSIPVNYPKVPVYSDVIWSTQSLPWSLLTPLTWASWGGVQQGVLTASQNEIRQDLEQNLPIPPQFVTSPFQMNAPQLTPDQILNSLQNYNWSNF